MTSSEFTHWRAYHDLESFGPIREDYRSGIVASLLYNANRKEGASAMCPMDFFEDPEPQSPETMIALLDLAFGVNKDDAGI